MKIVGIDPGINGGICFLKDNEIRAVIPTPTKEYTVGTGKKIKTKKMVDAVVVADLLKHYKPDYIIIEKVGAMPNQGVTSMFSFGLATGIMYGIAGSVGLYPIEVRPQEWKKIILEGSDKDKEAAIQFCYKHFPFINLKATNRSKKDHDGMADAVCIACYGRYLKLNCINTPIECEEEEENESNI